jgi:hypothetical protein
LHGLKKFKRREAERTEKKIEAPGIQFFKKEIEFSALSAFSAPLRWNFLP